MKTQHKSKRKALRRGKQGFTHVLELFICIKQRYWKVYFERYVCLVNEWYQMIYHSFHSYWLQERLPDSSPAAPILWSLKYMVCRAFICLFAFIFAFFLQKVWAGHPLPCSFCIIKDQHIMHASQGVKPSNHERNSKPLNTSWWAKQEHKTGVYFEGFKGSTWAIYFGVAVKYHM